MLFLKTKQIWGNSKSPIWIDANDSIVNMMEAYPKNAGIGELHEKAERLLSKDFIQSVYKASYVAFRTEAPTLLESVIIRMLPESIKASKEQ